MSQNDEIKHLQLDSLNIPQEKLIQLIDLQVTLGSIVQHDLGNDLGKLRFCLRTLKSDLDVEMISEKLESDEVREKVKHLVKIINLTERFSENLVSTIDILFPPVHQEMQILISKPSFIFEKICSVWRENNVVSDKASPQTLEIVYPENILGIILNELVSNSIKHSSMCEIFYSWRIEGSNFICEIHDSGEGIVPNLESTSITVGEILDILKYGDTKPKGLSIINKLIIKSGGKLSFSKSNRLGGTEASITLPTYAYYLKGNTYEIK
jgi:signal transduction histidine kinase